MSLSPSQETIYDPWAEIYDSVYSYVRSDIPLYTSAAIESGGPVLELGVGTGRVAIPTAELGIDVVGVDNSKAMLAVASRKVATLSEDAGSLELIQADMRDFTLRDQEGRGRSFPLVTMPFRGFLAMLTVEDQFSALRRIYDHLQHDGILVFNIFVPDPNMALEQSDDLRHLMDVTDPETGLTRVLYQQSRYDFHNQIVSVRILIEDLDRDNVVTRSMYRDYQLRYCHRWEVHYMLQLCGFEIESLYGDFDLSDFDEASTEMIWVARKP